MCAKLALPFIVGMLTTNENPVYLDTRLDWRALAFVAALGGLTTVLFGLAPAIRASAASPATAAAVGDRSQTAHARMTHSLVATQIAFSLMILFVAALLLRSFDRLLQIDLGFTPERVALLSVESRDRLEPEQAREVGRLLRERVGHAGVESASLSGWALFRGWSWGNNLELPGGGRAQTFRLAVSPAFFRTMGTAVLDGREFEPTDNDGMNPMPVIVNEAFARTYFPGSGRSGPPDDHHESRPDASRTTSSASWPTFATARCAARCPLIFLTHGRSRWHAADPDVGRSADDRDACARACHGSIRRFGSRT